MNTTNTCRCFSWWA